MSIAKLHPRLRDYVKDRKWPDLTPIQKAAFDPIFQGVSCVIEAPTSGGKTEAVLFPLLTRISSNKSTGFKILYIAPLKALLNDLALRVLPLAVKCNMEAFKWHGDVGQGEKVKQFLFPSDILMTTPESIEAILLRRGNWIEVFENLETIVIDEAHYFALTERGSHLVSLLRRIEDGIKRAPQRIAVTATIGNPSDLLRWLMGDSAMSQNIKVSGAAKERDFKIQYFEPEEVSFHNHLYSQLVNKKSIVFERSRSATEETATGINERNQYVGAKFPVKVRTHHSSVSKRLREEAEGSIKQNNESSLNAIISTSTLELGIDIGELDQVIQIGSLTSSGSFLQRVGRTGRRPGQAQFFRGLCSEPEELILQTACVSLGLERVSESILFPHSAYHILAHQTICLCLQKQGITPMAAWQILSTVSCFSAIAEDKFNRLVDYMIKEEYLRKVGGGVLVTGNRTEDEFLRSNWKRLFAIFDTNVMYNVVDGKKVIGTLDSSFARSKILPFVFVLGGQEWETIKIDHELQQISVKKNKTGVAPKWKVFAGFDVPFEVAQEVGKILMTDSTLSFLDGKASQVLNRERKTVKGLKWTCKKWVLDSGDERSKYYLWTFSGDKINRSLALMIEAKLKVETEINYQRIVLNFGNDIPEASSVVSLVELIKTLNQGEMEAIAYARIRPKWFSKFSPCLPEALAVEAMVDKDYHFNGLVRELESSKVTAVPD